MIHWKNSITIFKHALKVANENSYNSYLINYHLGDAFWNKRKTGEAISHYKMAIKLNPDDFWAHNKLGHALVQKGEMKEAVYHYRETVRLRPDFDAARDNLEFALLRLRELE